MTTRTHVINWIIALAWGLFCWALFLGWIGGGLQ